MLNDVLDFSKIEAGKQELEYEDFEPRKVAEDVVEVLAVILPSASASSS